jgi:helix-turn-helix protein
MTDLDVDNTRSDASERRGTRVEEEQVVAQAQRETERAARERKKRGPRKITEDESLIVDFIANFVAGGNDFSFEPVRGRVLMSNKRLVLATSSNRTVVPITSIFDIAVGQVPREVEEFFDHTVMVGYIVDGQKRTTVVGGGRESIEKFSLLLYRAALNGSRAAVKHPAEIGGRVMETRMRTAALRLESDAVIFTGNEALAEGGSPFAIDLASVVFFEVRERTVRDEKRLVLSVQHVVDGQTHTTEVSLGSRRKMNILGRYVRQMYYYIESSVRDVDLDEQDLEVLVGLYSTGADVDLGSLLEVDDAELEARMETLFENDLITEDSTSCSLTPQGRILVNDEIEGVNA